MKVNEPMKLETGLRNAIGPDGTDAGGACIVSRAAGEGTIATSAPDFSSTGSAAGLTTKM